MERLSDFPYLWSYARLLLSLRVFAMRDIRSDVFFFIRGLRFASPTVKLCRPCGALLLRLPGASIRYAAGQLRSGGHPGRDAPTVYYPWAALRPRLSCVAPAGLYGGRSASAQGRPIPQKRYDFGDVSFGRAFTKGCPLPSSMRGRPVSAAMRQASLKHEYLSKQPSTMGCGVPSFSAR